ncbi:MAG: acetyl-CoA carboxylase, carboxyltransferase subunit beta [Bacteroides sp.]|nr:acetyl-CoA carboxylase, carboxyltransferase subunit beta [Bacteroides sp.]MCM1549414.1 acetyl-CoA carboxylase, carboxyltransferase subunit beta [Clostridium sp.]
MGFLGKTKAELARYATVLKSSGKEASDFSDDFEPVIVKEKTEKQEEGTIEMITCSSCKKEISSSVMKKNLFVCPECGAHNKISAARRMRSMVDSGTFRKLKCKVPFVDPLEYPDYEEKIVKLQEKTGLEEGVLIGVGEIQGQKAMLAVMGSEFLMGSMGIALGEKVAYAFEVADKNKLPVIMFTASGGARMQEGILSLMQMAKTSAAVQRFSEHGGLYVVCLTHPTTGGVSASFATLGDITLAEPGALIGFAGPRVIEQTIGQKLPEGFQRAEYLESHGFVDQIVPRNEMREVVGQILKLHERKRWPL